MCILLFPVNDIIHILFNYIPEHYTITKGLKSKIMTQISQIILLLINYFISPGNRHSPLGLKVKLKILMPSAIVKRLN